MLFRLHTIQGSEFGVQHNASVSGFRIQGLGTPRRAPMPLTLSTILSGKCICSWGSGSAFYPDFGVRMHRTLGVIVDG